MGVHLIRYLGSRFITLAKPLVSKKVEDVFDETVNKILKQKLKTHDGNVFAIELEFEQQDYSKGQNFKRVADRFK